MLLHFPTISATQGGQRLARTSGKRRTTTSRPEPAPLEQHLRHSFKRQGKSFFCQRCYQTAFTAATASNREKTEACKGEHPGLKKLVQTAQDLEHSLLLVVWQGKPTLLCEKCGAMAATDLHSGLRMPCSGHPTNGRAQDGVSRAMRGRHPHQRNKGKLDALLKIAGCQMYPLQPLG